jgi:signal transduction histidine kinase
MTPRAKITLNSLLSRLLLYMLLACYGLLFYAGVILAMLLLGVVHSRDADLAFNPPWWLAILTLIAISPTIVPLYRWLRGRINEIIYGEHDDPYALISAINAQLLAMTSSPMTLPGVTVTIARALNLPFVALVVYGDGAGEPGEDGMKEQAARYEAGIAPPAVEMATLPLLYLGKALGELVVSARHAHESLSDSDREVLEGVAQQIAVALRVEQLSADLQASRERLVIGREEERRRIRNDLHDGLGPTLSSMQLQLGTLRNLIRQQPEKAEAIAAGLGDDLRQATAEIRQLVYDLRPPLLDELGLVEAIKSLCPPGAPLTLTVSAPSSLPAMPAALEVALYRIAGEAIHNVMRHAQATRCTVTLSVEEGSLTLRVGDNGVGLPAGDSFVRGVGIRSMQERAAELGGALTVQTEAQGGTEVAAYFPLGRS